MNFNELLAGTESQGNKHLLAKTKITLKKPINKRLKPFISGYRS